MADRMTWLTKATSSRLRAVGPNAVNYPSGTDTGLVKSFDNLNGVATSLTYTPRNMMKSIVSSPSVLNLAYDYDAAGNLATFTDNLNPASFTDSSTSNTYNYDNTTYRLASVSGTAAAGFTYNYAGDVSTKTANGSTYTHQYDLFRNLTGISQSPGGNLATFSYDGDGKRISKLAGGVRTIYHYDKEGRLLSESDANGNAICDYIYLGTNLVGKMYEPASSGIYYYHTDPAGTPLAVTNTSGAVVWRGYYEPFGNEYAIQGTIGNDVRFAGNKKDDETGLNYFGARYMDSALGRFSAPDPVGPVDSKTGKINDKVLKEPQRINAYAYGLNNPGHYVDRNGLWGEDVNAVDLAANR
jgi:RHS repeat-associated protein